MKSQLQCGATYINNDSPSPQHVSLRLPPQLTPHANDNSDLPAHEHMRCAVDIKCLSCLLVCAVYNSCSSQNAAQVCVGQRCLFVTGQCLEVQWHHFLFILRTTGTLRVLWNKNRKLHYTGTQGFKKITLKLLVLTPNSKTTSHKFKGFIGGWFLSFVHLYRR